MYEFILAFFVSVTIYIDTLSILLKGSGSKEELGKVYVVSQSLSYLTRLSTFFILPIVGLILDEVITFQAEYFLAMLSFFLIMHSVIYYSKSSNVLRNSDVFVGLFNVSLIKFFFFGVFKLFLKNDSGNVKKLYIRTKKLSVLYCFSHCFLALIFPLVISLGVQFGEYRALMMGGTSVYTGVFSIYITFFIERKIPYLKNEERHIYISSLVFSKVVSSSLVAFLIIFYLLIGW
jgi:hypothetical protein